MELKLNCQGLYTIIENAFNRTIMELKFATCGTALTEGQLLIAPLWN